MSSVSPMQSLDGLQVRRLRRILTSHSVEQFDQSDHGVNEHSVSLSVNMPFTNKWSANANENAQQPRCMFETQ